MTEQNGDTRDTLSASKKWIKTPVGYIFMSLTAATFSILLYAGVQFFYQKYVSGSSQPVKLLDNPASAETPADDRDVLLRSAQGFRLVSKKVGPAVVRIESKKIPAQVKLKKFRNGRDRNLYEDQDPFQEFFEHFGLPFGFGSQQPEGPQIGLGSGILIDGKGHIVTNHHVITEASEIVIGLADQPIDRKAKVLAVDSRTDLAVLKIQDTEGLPQAIEWGDSDAVEVGDWAIAIGSPFNIGQSVTVGIISAKGRRELAGPGDQYTGDLIQTDAAINPGNSGGPLCNLEGHVIGVNRAIFTRSGGYMGIGFAIPSNLAKYVVNTLISEGKIIRGWLGILIQRIDPDLAKDLGITHGVTVHEVLADSPAEKVGIQAGDIIVEVNGAPIKDTSELQALISQQKPGAVVKLEVISYENKKKKSVSVKISEMPPNETAQAEPSGEKGTGRPDKLGMAIAGTRNNKGVLIEFIEPGSPAQQIGLQEGDIITVINRKNISSISSYQSAIKSSKRFHMVILRKGRRLFFQFSAPH